MVNKNVFTESVMCDLFRKYSYANDETQLKFGIFQMKKVLVELPEAYINNSYVRRASDGEYIFPQLVDRIESDGGIVFGGSDIRNALIYAVGFLGGRFDDDDRMAVEFPEYVSGHTCSGLIKSGRGLWIGKYRILPYDLIDDRGTKIMPDISISIKALN